MPTPQELKALSKAEEKALKDRETENAYYEAARTFIAVPVGDYAAKQSAKKALFSAQTRMRNRFGKDNAEARMQTLSSKAYKGERP